MMLCLPALYYCIMPGAVQNHACTGVLPCARKSCTVQVQHRVRCIARRIMAKLAFFCVVHEWHYSMRRASLQLHSPSRFPKLNIAFRCLTGTTQAQAQIKA
jgi:hypothetical protein